MLNRTQNTRDYLTASLSGMSREAQCQPTSGAPVLIPCTQTDASGSCPRLSTLLCAQVSHGEPQQGTGLCSGAVWGRVQVRDSWGWNPKQDCHIVEEFYCFSRSESKIIFSKRWGPACGLLGCDSIESCGIYPVFWGNMLPASSWLMCAAWGTDSVT